MLLRAHSDEEVQLWRNLIPPEEEKGPFVPEWVGGYRWFRDPKVVCFEHYRRPRARPPTTCEAA
jgi:hypothetical protein